MDFYPRDPRERIPLDVINSDERKPLDNDDLNARLIKAEQKLAGNSAGSDNSAKELESKNAEIADLKAQVAELQSEIEDKDARIAELEASLEAATSEV